MRSKMWRSSRVLIILAVALPFLLIIGSMNHVKISMDTFTSSGEKPVRRTLGRSSSSETTFPRRHLSSVLHKQALSHHSFHSIAVQQALAALFAPPKTVVIVGVEYGGDLKHFAAAGYRVIAFEPMPRFVALLQKYITKNPDWDVQLFPYAAGNETSTLNLTYQFEPAGDLVSVRRVDDLVDEDVAVMSVDVQGNEFGVLSGATGLLNKTVSSVWVEAFSCNERVLQLIDMLDEQFVFFDFVPWGRPLSAEKGSAMDGRENYHFHPTRPSQFDEYIKWLCSTRQGGYRMLQTDLLGVRRNLINKVLPSIVTIAEDACKKENSRCLLRSLLKESKE